MNVQTPRYVGIKVGARARHSDDEGDVEIAVRKKGGKCEKRKLKSLVRVFLCFIHANVSQSETRRKRKLSQFIRANENFSYFMGRDFKISSTMI